MAAQERLFGGLRLVRSTLGAAVPAWAPWSREQPVGPAPVALTAPTDRAPTDRAPTDTAPTDTAPTDTARAGNHDPDGEVEAELDAIRAELIEDRRRLLDELRIGEADLVGLLGDTGDGSDDLVDAGSRTLDRASEMSVNANTRDLVEQTDLALQRLDEGQYGLCERCGLPIPRRRLQAFPRATMCLSCKQAQERSAR